MNADQHVRGGEAAGHRAWRRATAAAISQGLTLVQFSAQLEPCLTQENNLHTLNTP